MAVAGLALTSQAQAADLQSIAIDVANSFLTSGGGHGRLLGAVDCQAELTEYQQCINDAAANINPEPNCDFVQEVFDKFVGCWRKIDSDCNGGASCSDFAAATENMLNSLLDVDCSLSCPLSGGAIAGIVIGCIAFVALVGLGVFCFLKKRNQNAQPQQPQQQPPVAQAEAVPMAKSEEVPVQTADAVTSDRKSVV